MTRSSGPDRREERFDTEDVHHAREVVGEHVQRHLGRYLRQRLHQKVRRPHPHLQRGERMLDAFGGAHAWLAGSDRAAPARLRRRVRVPIV